MRLPASLRSSLYVAGGVLALSGIAWLLAPRSLRAVTMEIHGGATLVFLVLIGSAVALHVGSGWREARNRVSGTLLSALLTALTLTGFLLYYAGAEEARAAASVVHRVLGLAAPLVLALHVRPGCPTRSR